MLLNKIDELRSEIEMNKRSSESTIHELRQQKMQLQEKHQAKIQAELSVMKTENLTLKNTLMDKISELNQLRAKRSSGQNKLVQTTEIINLTETKEGQFFDALADFEWIKKLLFENVADSERVCAGLSGRGDAAHNCDSEQNS